MFFFCAYRSQPAGCGLRREPVPLGEQPDGGGAPSQQPLELSLGKDRMHACSLPSGSTPHPLAGPTAALPPHTAELELSDEEEAAAALELSDEEGLGATATAPLTALQAVRHSSRTTAGSRLRELVAQEAAPLEGEEAAPSRALPQRMAAVSSPAGKRRQQRNMLEELAAAAAAEADAEGMVVAEAACNDEGGSDAGGSDADDGALREGVPRRTRQAAACHTAFTVHHPLPPCRAAAAPRSPAAAADSGDQEEPAPHLRTEAPQRRAQAVRGRPARPVPAAQHGQDWHHHAAAQDPLRHR